MHSFGYYDPVRSISLNGRSHIITLELSKLDEVVEKPASDMSVQEQWAVYFRYLTGNSKRCKINEILRQEEGIAMASEVLITISKDEIERARLESELKYELDTQSKLAYAKQEGREEVARNALSKGIPLDLIQDITGLDAETIRELADG